MKRIANHRKTNVNIMYRKHTKLTSEDTQKIKAYQTLYNITMAQLENIIREEFISIWTNPNTYLPEEFYSK